MNTARDQLEQINRILQLGANDPKSFSEQLYAVARDHNTPLSVVADVARDFVVMGLSTEAALKRTTDALTSGL